MRAESLAGEQGRFRLEAEGRDDDGDGVFNEDAREGVYFDRSFAHGFPYPAPEAGPWPSYAPAARAIMDFLLERRNVAAAVVFGPANDLLSLPKGGDSEGGRTIPTHPVAGDLKLLGQLAKAYGRSLTDHGLDGERPGRRTHGGGFTPWLYYQYGTFAIELDVWGVPKGPEEEGTSGDFEEPKERARNRAILRYLDEARPEAFQPWADVMLPDGTAVEVGGLDPLAELVPPPAELEPALAAHVATVRSLALWLPSLELARVVVEPLGAGVFRLEVVGRNVGFLPTHTEMAVKARTHVPVRLEVELPDGATLVTGQRWAAAERLAGSSGTIAASWLIRAESGARVTVRLTSQSAGRVSRSITLQEPL